MSGYMTYWLHSVLVRANVSQSTPNYRAGRSCRTLREVRALADWWPPTDRCVWFGVNPVGRHVRYGRGAEADVTRVRALFADLDVKPGKQFDTIDQCHEAARILEVI